MKILIETIPHSSQRYPTVGDWQWEDDIELKPISENFCVTRSIGEVLHIRVSSLSNWRYEALVGLHEAIEAILCKHAGITEEQVDAFDMDLESSKARRTPGFTGEPGDDPAAPYHQQHRIASLLESRLADALGVDWSAYESELDSL